MNNKKKEKNTQLTGEVVRLCAKIFERRTTNNIIKKNNVAADCFCYFKMNNCILIIKNGILISAVVFISFIAHTDLIHKTQKNLYNARNPFRIPKDSLAVSLKE